MKPSSYPGLPPGAPCSRRLRWTRSWPVPQSAPAIFWLIAGSKDLHSPMVGNMVHGYTWLYHSYTMLYPPVIPKLLLGKMDRWLRGCLMIFRFIYWFIAIYHVLWVCQKAWCPWECELSNFDFRVLISESRRVWRKLRSTMEDFSWILQKQIQQETIFQWIARIWGWFSSSSIWWNSMSIAACQHILRALCTYSWDHLDATFGYMQVSYYTRSICTQKGPVNLMNLKGT